MENIQEQKVRANQLRKDSKYDEALPLYKTLWEESKDSFDGTGYLSCLRKLHHFDEAIPFANELIKLFPDFEWCRKEVVWTRIQGQLNNLPEESLLSTVISVADSVMELNPDFLAKKLTVFKVLKYAKKHDDWDCIATWIDKLDPTSLSDKPIKIAEGRDGWCDQEIWYNYKINSLLEHNDPELALAQCTALEGKYPKNAKFFIRLKALSYRYLKKFDESIELYKKLCTTRRPDWWLLHEYGKVLVDADKKEDALKIFCQAALLSSKLQMLVKLFQDIGDLCIHFSQKEDALCHYRLVAFIRTENGWPISSDLNSKIQIIDKECSSLGPPSDISSCLKACKDSWFRHVGTPDNSSQKRAIKKSIRGKISIAAGRPLCFINTREGLSAICFQNEISSSIKNGDIVLFDAEPSFDKKKNCESWRAIQVRKT